MVRSVQSTFVCALLALGLCRCVEAAQVLPLGAPLPWDFAVVYEAGAQAGWCTPTRYDPDLVFPAQATTVAQLGGTALLLGGGQGWAVEPSRHVTPLGPCPAQIRQAALLPDSSLLLLVGGTWQGGRLREARVVQWNPGTPPETVREITPASLHPSLIRSTLITGRAVVLIGLWKTTIFDPVLRLRPWVYSYNTASHELIPRWKGTSFSRPYQDAVFADVCGGSAPELCALEQTADGRGGITAYEWHGSGVSGVARSRGAWVLRQSIVAIPASVGGKARLGVMERTEKGNRLLVLAARNTSVPETVLPLEVIRTDDLGGSRETLLSWTVVRPKRDGPAYLLALTTRRLIRRALPGV